MELIVYDTALVPLGLIEAFETLTWTRRFQSPGEFSLLLPFSEEAASLLQDERIIMRRGDAEAMQIQRIHINKNIQGKEQIEVSGRTLMNWLDRRIVLYSFCALADSGVSKRDIVIKLITENITSPTDPLRKIPMTQILERTDVADAALLDAYESDEHGVVLDVVASLLEYSGLGLRVVTDVANQTHSFDVYPWRDRTTSQDAAEPCVFSQEMETLDEQDYTYSSENYKTTLVGYLNVPGLDAAGLNRRETYVEINPTENIYDPSTRRTEEVLYPEPGFTLLRRKAEEELAKSKVEQTFAGVLNHNAQMKYRTDFDVGDKVTCLSSRWGVSLDALITEVTETFSGNTVDVSVVFGEGTPSLKSVVAQVARRYGYRTKSKTSTKIVTA